jgi:hypothetical protein
VLRDDFTAESDVDVPVEFEPGHTPGLAFFAMQDELSALLGRKVDLYTPGFLSQYFREEVLNEGSRSMSRLVEARHSCHLPRPRIHPIQWNATWS